MNKGGLGVGSASIVLVFAILSLTIFSLITFVVAANDKSLIEAQSELVIGYYTADSAAERILAELLDMESIPETVSGVGIGRAWNDERQLDSIYFFYPINDIMALYVNVVIEEYSFDILSWRMYSTDEWAADESVPIWQGD